MSFIKAGYKGQYLRVSVEAVHNEEGRAYNSGGSYRYEYVLRDHLGNTRLVFTDKNGSGSIDNSEILSESHYYPFGRKMDGAWYSDAGAGKYRYLYNGKELNDEFDLNFYDYGARWYDPGMGSWWQIDPLAEKSRRFSPYVYAFNNPVRFIDPDGREGQSTHTDKYGNVTNVFDDGDLGVYRHKGNEKQTRAEVKKKYNKDTNTSAGGERMGRTLHTFSFVEGASLERGQIVPTGHIDFGSNWAETSVQWGLDQSNGLINYGLNAGNGQEFDLKERAVRQGRAGGFYNGSTIFTQNGENVYASARDAGNFLAGAKADKSFAPNELVMYGFGVFNASGNNFRNVPEVLLNEMIINASGGSLLQPPHYGEDRQSGLGIQAGMDNSGLFSGHWFLWHNQHQKIRE
ncbi:RHS repeat domain-containing protein [Spirosoma jeollabukense]